MVKKHRTPTLCEWALGFTVEEIHAQQQRRRQRREGRSSQERFRVEISTDDESEEDTLKITYPRSGGPKLTETKVKKVRFDHEPAKSAIKKGSDSEASDTEVSGSESKKKSDSAKSSDSSKSSKKTSGDKSTDESSGKNKNKGKKAKPKTVEEEDSSDSEVEKPKQNNKQNKKRNQAKPDADDSSDSEDAKPNKKKQNKKQARKNDKSKSEDDGEDANDASDEASDSDEDTSKKRNKNTGNKTNTDGKATSKKSQEAVKDNNVGPTTKKNKKVVNDTSKGSRKGPPSVASSIERLRPEGFPPPHPRLPNLIMPIRAEVLQVEHTIEGVEDPRPNAFHSGEHGVVRVYHGPAYGNPHGMLYPRRDLSKAALPAGMPHPANNPWQQGFAHPSNPGDIQHQDQSPWDSAPFTFRPAPKSPMGADPAVSAPSQAPWMHDVLAGQQGAQGSTKPFMSGALNSGMPPMTAGDKDRAWDTNAGPSMEAKPLSPSLPINIKMYSYGARPDPWSKEGRERNYWDGSLQNNMGPAMYDRNAYHWGSSKGSNNGNNRSSAKHHDLSWEPQHIEAAAAKNGRPQNGNGHSSWAQTDGNGDPQNGSQNGSNRDQWGAKNGTSWDRPNDTSWSGTNENEWASNSNTNGNGNNDTWNNNWDSNTNNNGDTWCTGSNNSKGSKKSNRSVTKPHGDNVNWGDSSNNVGCSSGHSNHSGGSGGSKKSNRSQKSNKAPDDWANNAGPGNAPNNSAGDGGAWSATPASGDDWSKNNNGGNGPSHSMPGAWDATPNHNQNGDPFWGDPTAAQVVPDSQW